MTVAARHQTRAADGSVYNRDAQGANAEWQQRTKQLSSSFQISARERKLQGAINAANAKVGVEAGKVQKFLDLNSEAEQQLVAANPAGWGTATMAMFGSLKPADLLVAFYAVRALPSIKGVSKCKVNKGSVPEASAGVDNAILRAYNSRGPPVQMAAAAAQAPVVAAAPAPPAVVDVGGGIASCTQASELLQRPGFVDLANRALVGHSVPRGPAPPPPAVLAAADRLAALSYSRLQGHILRRVPDGPARKSWVWPFFVKQVNALAAVAALNNQQHQDLQCATSSTSLLRAPAGGVFTKWGTSNGDCEGCYLFWDTVNLCWVRSGKVAGLTADFNSRIGQHRACAGKASATSPFYVAYPTLANPGVDHSVPKAGRRGNFEQLTAYVGLGFRRSDVELGEEEMHELFVFDDQDVDSIKKVGMRGASTEEKMLQIISYSLELFYDLCIPDSNNVSASPGFESFIGVYGGSDD